MVSWAPLTVAWRFFTAQWAECAPFCEDLSVAATLSALENLLGIVAMESWRGKTPIFRPSWWYTFCTYALLQR